MSQDVTDGGSRLWEVAVFAAIAALMGWDLTVDYLEGTGWGHIATEFAILVLAAAAAVRIWLELKRTRTDLSSARAEASRWRTENRELLAGFGNAVSRQFARWALTPAEADIGLLLLKGLSHKEIAAMRDTSERTVREQARAVYRKSGVNGRSAFSAFFLEDIALAADAAQRVGETSPDSRDASQAG